MQKSKMVINASIELSRKKYLTKNNVFSTHFVYATRFKSMRNRSQVFELSDGQFGSPNTPDKIEWWKKEFSRCFLSPLYLDVGHPMK